MINEDRKKLYDALSSEYDLGTYEEFERNIGDSVKRKKLYDVASADYDLGDFESYSQRIGPTHKESLDAFTAEHGSWLNDFEARDSAETKKMVASSRSGLYMPSENAISGEERERYMELHKQEEALKKAWFTSDEYLAQKDADALFLSNVQKDLSRQRVEYAQANPPIKQEGLFQINPYAVRGVEADTELERFATASRLMDDAIKMHNAPSRYDDKNVFLKFGKGAGDVLSDADFWTAGLTEIADNLGVRDVLSTVQEKLGNLNDLSEEAIENILSPAEKAVLQAWAINTQEQLKRKDDLSRAYQAGQGATESLGFMAEFALTGGIGKAATEGVEQMVKWLGKKALTKVGGMTDDVAAKVLKETGEKIAQSTVGKYGVGLAESLAEAAGRTGVMPSTFRNISEKATEIETDENGNNYLVKMNDAFAKGYVDSFIENLSEGGRVNALGTLFGDVAGKIPAYKRMVDKFSHTKASELWDAFNSSGVMNTLRAGGWHGLGEEYLEEWYGNALRTLTGVDKEALKDFATVDNQIVTLTSFLPMTIFGGTVSTAQVLSANKDLEKKAAALKSALMERGYDEAQANNMIDMMRGAAPAEVSETLTPIVNSVANRNTNEAAALMKPVGEFAAAVQRWQSFNIKYNYQEQEQRDGLRAQMEENLGQFWQQDENGRQTVQRGVNDKGEVVYMLGKPSVEDVEAGVTSEVAAVTSDGRKVFVNPSEYQLEDELEMNTFLGNEIMAEKGNQEQARMIEEKEAKIAAIREAAVPGTAVNIGTAEAPMQAIVLQRNPDGVIVNTPDGQTRQMTYEEFGNYVGVNAVPMTDAQIDEHEADVLTADRAQREAALDQEYENEDAALDELAEAEDEIEQAVDSNIPLPMKADGSVDQTALWNNDPERWAQWNDEQRQDGGANSLAYVSGAIAKEQAKIAELQAAYAAESDFDARDAIEKEIADTQARVERLTAIQQGYGAQAEAAAAPVVETQPESTLTARMASEMTQQELNDLDESYDIILSQTRVPEEKARLLQEYLDRIAEGSTPIKVLTRDNYEDVMRAAGCPEVDIAAVGVAMANLPKGQAIAGFASGGKIFAMADSMPTIEEARITYVHERQHLINSADRVSLPRMVSLLGTHERALEVLKLFVGEDGVLEYKHKTIVGLADEIIARCMEIAYTTEEFSVDLQSKGLPDSVISIIEEINNGQRNNKSLSAARRSAYAGISQQGNNKEESGDSGQVSGGVLGEQRYRSSRLSQEGTGAGSTGEGAEVISEEQLNAPNSGTAQQIIATDGEVLADTDGKGGVRFSIRTWNEGGRDYLAAWLANDTTLTEDEKADIIARMDEFYKNALLYSDTYAPFGTWSDAGVRYDNNGNPLMSVIKANGDYAMNLDFSLVCKKRRPLNRLLRILVNRNAFASYTLKERELAEINWILQEHGFEVACALCFVDSKRYRVAGVADVFALLYNRLVKALAPKGVKVSHFNYNDNPNVEVVENGLDTLPEDQINWAEFDRLVSGLKPNSVEYKVAQYLREHPEARKLVDATDFIEAEGFESVKENNPDLLKFYNMKKGTGGPKASFGDVQYLNDILKKEKSFDAEKAYAVGGVRLQSFSDFVPHMYFDYMQLFAELAAKKLPLHAYTKEVLFAKIFGLTGAKINMSLVPAVVEGGIAPGLDAEGNYAWADPVTDAEGNVIQQGQSFPYDEAMAIQQAEGYSKNCGIIAVGISDAHIEKMLDDPNIPFIIPYHKSSLNAIVARMTNIDQYKDYTNVQNTRKASGSKLDKGTKDFNFNEYLHGLGESGTPQQAAQAYLDWCRENNYKPKFSQFAYHPNYYKLLQDFNTIDLATGEYAPQGAVTMTFPTEESAFGNVETLIQQGLQEDAELEEKMEQEIDGIADQVLARLEEISKEPKMSEKQQAKKMAELADERTAKIKAKAKGPIDLIEEAKKAVAREERLAFRVISQENYEMAERMIDNLAGRPYFQRLEGEYELGKLASNYAELADIIMAIDANKAYTPVGTSILGFFAENPDMHFPLLFNDSAASKETANAFAEELSKVNDPYALFFMRDAWRIHKTSLEQAGLGVKASSTTKYNKAIDARAEEIKAAEVKGTAFNFKKQESSLDEIDAIFKQLNKDPELALLHDKVMGVARKLGVKVSFAGKRGQTAGESLGDKVSYDYKFFNSPAVADQKKCNTITHELIHSITVYAIYLENQAPTALTDGMLEAVGILRDVYNQIARDPAFKGEYGVSDVYEMVAELSNAQFRDKLKEKNLFQRILDALKRLLGIDTVKEDSAYQVLSDTLDYIIDNYDEAAFDAYALYASKNRSYGRMMIQEDTLVPGHKKGQPMLSDAEMMADVSFRITKNTKATIETWFNKAGVDPEMTEATINYLDFAFEDTTEQLCAAKWYLNGKISLPDEDEYKVRDAVKVAKQNKVDALSYASPMDILNTFGQPKSKVKPIDPDTVKEFSNKKELAEGIVVYDVQDDFEGQAAVRKIIDTHWGEDANPWCLAARTNGDLERAKDMWLHYSKYPKRIAFRNGKLLAFYASANDKTWWDRNDEPHTNIPYSVKSKEGEYEVSTNYELKEGNKKAKKVSVGKSDKKGRTAYFVGNRLESAGIQDGERNLFYLSFPAGATLSDSTYGVGRSIEIQYGPYKNVTQISFERRTKDEPTYYVRVGYSNNGVRAISFVEDARSWDIRYGINGDQIFVGRAQLNFDLTNELSNVYSGAYHMYRINDEEYEIARGTKKVGIVKKGEKVTMQMLEAFGEDGAPAGALLDFINDMGWNRSDYPYPNPADADLLRRDDEVREQIRKVENEINEIAGGRYLSSVPAIRFRVTAEQDKAYMDAVEAGDMETAQRMVNEAARAAGYTIRGEHGRVSKFTIFDRDKANPEGNWGQGFYFSNNEEDVEENYATVDGPDLEAKIDREVERRVGIAEMNEEFNEDGEVDIFAIRDKVEDEFITSEPNVVHAAIKMDKPFVVGHGMVVSDEAGNTSYDMQETYLDVEYEYDEDGEIDYDSEPTGTLIDLIDALNEEILNYDWANFNANEILQDAYDGITASQFEIAARELLNSHIDELVNDRGDVMTSEILRAAIERAGFDGIIDNTVNQKFGTQRKYGTSMAGMDSDTRHYISFDSSNIKDTNPVTYDDAGNVIPLSERFNPENADIRFRTSNNNQAIFVSNAAKAVEGIKQEKATTEQWLKMIEKNGGLKAGEDKWMGLSDFLKSSDKKTITKQEVLDFINENMIVIEEQHYSSEGVRAEADRILNERYPGWEDAFSFDWDPFMEEPHSDIYDEVKAARLYNETHEDQVETDEDGDIINDADYDKVEEFGAELAGIWYGRGKENTVREINGIREDYTTAGLENNHEIALTVPTIKPWNLHDETHFGDAGGGRAVAWIRFGDTQITEEGSLMEYEPKSDVEREIKNYIEYAMRNGDDFETSVGYAYNQITDAPQESVGWTEEAVTAVADGMRGKEKVRKVLVIDEVQSKRHQEGREKGYIDQARLDEIERRKAEIDRQLKTIAPAVLAGDRAAKRHENLLYKEIGELRSEGYALTKDRVPDAPFDKNWHELAMKRMLRYAAENGYDVVAWTTGDQQADRYDLSRDVKKISASKPTKDGERIVNIYYRDEYNDFKNLVVDKEGKVVQGDYSGNALADVIGKEMALQIMKAEESTEFKGEGLKIGGEGMRGFYDKMLPAFMNKYGKKWGVKVEDIDLPNLGKSGRTMHSVPVTEEMKASVMEGQVMFRTIPITQEVQDEMDAISATAIVRGNYLKAPNGADTNLTPEQWAMVRTKNFKNWFGDWENDRENASKVVDENGEPKVVFHGSNWRPILEEPGKATFKMRSGLMGRGAYFTDNFTNAADYAREKYEWENYKEVDEDFVSDNGYVTEAFLNIRNEDNIREYYGETYYLATDPNQIKSATDNTGEFSTEDKDIRYRVMSDVNTNPTEAQKKAGNYKMGHIRLDGYNITIENPKGSVRRGIDSKGNAWENTLNNDYGYIRGTEGVDGDHIDVYLSDNPTEGNVFVVDQVNPKTREFDEHKVMYGFNSAEEAREAYLANFSEGWNGLGTITEVSKDEFKKWIESSHRKTKPFSEYKSVKTIEVQSEGEDMEDNLLPSTGTPTDEVVANGLQLTPAQTAEVAANIFAALPEESRKKITEGLNGNILGLKDAILQIPTSLASKENWNDEDKQVADVVAEEMTKMAGEMTRPFSVEEGLWLLYNNLNKGTDLVSQASRALVQRNLGFDAETLAKQEQAKDDVRFRTVGDATSNAQASLYNRGAVNVWTRLKESFVDMQASVEELVKAIEKRTGKVAQGFENILLALNQQSSKGLAAMESYTQKFLNPMFDEIRRIMDETKMKYEDVVRYVILKHGLERNKKLAQRDARAHYQEIYDDIISKITGMTAAQKRTYLTNAQLKEGDAKADLATLQAVDMSTMTDEEKREHKKKLAAARKAVEEAEEHLKRAQKIASLSEQEAQDELDKIFEKIENGTDSVFKEMRENDYSGISSMFYDQLGVDRKNFSTEEQYQAALMEAKKDRYSSLKDIEAAAEAEVKSFEGKTDTKELWKRINAATKETLRQQYEANMISKDQYLNLRDMFEYYVPLRGFKDNTAEDMYTYYRKPNSTGYTKPILGAEGRKTEAESPFGWIAAMAGSAIASNVKNEAKLALYYFVSNRPENGIATISKTWFVDSGEVDERGKKIFKPAYPPFSEDLSSAEGKAQYEIWQANMKELQKKGQAYEAGQRLNLGNAVVNISDANKPEHIVNVKVGGKDYTIIINGNPRAAQAINGDLNIEGTAQDYSALFGPVLRWMSSVNTSYNPEFWITNMMRDMAFTMMAVNIKEDPVYRRKFSKNYRKAFKVVSLVAKNEKGTIGDTYLEQQYKDFVKYGGVTGYTQIKDSETWEQEIENYLSSNDPKSVKNGKVMRGMKSAFHAAHRFGESLEQVSRFAAFLTARETGKSINEAINDAKEITVNFNRKGSGKMITLEEAKYLTGKDGQPLTKPQQWMVVGLSSIAPLGRRFIMFFNAAIQGLNATYKLMKKNPKRFTGWALGYAAVGMMNAVLHAMLDDDDDYLDIPQYERRNSLMIGGNGAYFKWALPQEARAFYALGDLAVETVMGRNPHQNFLGEALKIGTEILPVNPSEGWKAFMPSVAIPFIELALNEDYKGAPIYNEQKWLSEEEKERAAKWSNAYQGTGWTYVKIAQGLNFITGGDKHDAGLINLQPEKLEHLVQSAFGGTIRTADKFINTISAALDPEEPMTIRQTPFLNRFLTINDERFKNVHVNDVFDYYKADAEHALTLEKQYIKDRDMDSLTELRSSDEYQWAKIYGKYKKPLKAIQDKIKVADGTAEKKELMKQHDELKKRMIKEISEL